MGKDITMQTNNLLIDKEIDSFSSKGSTDAKLNQEVTIDIGKIKPAARNIYYKIKAQYAGLIEQTKIQYEQTKDKISVLSSDINDLKDRLDGFEIMSLPKIYLYLILPGWLFVGGDVLFSMEGIVKLWGLGQENPIDQWLLALAIGFMPFFVKMIIDRFVEPYLEEGSKQLKRLLKGSFIALGLLAILCFCQIAYVRGIAFRFMNTDSVEDNLYNQLFELYPNAMYSSFVLVALMFIIGSGFLLSYSSKQLAKRKKFKTLSQDQEAKQNELNFNLEALSEIKRKQIEIEMLFNDWNNKDECVEHLENELKYAYKNGFTTELISNVESDANNISFGIVDEKINDNFHNYAKQLIDKYSMNKKGNTYNA